MTNVPWLRALADFKAKSKAGEILRSSLHFIFHGGCFIYYSLKEDGRRAAADGARCSHHLLNIWKNL